MDKRINSIFEIYKESVKPLLVDIQVRSKKGKLPDNFLNEIRALNDHIARCYREDITPKDIERELTKAEGHLRRLIFDCFKQLNIYLSDFLEYKERWFFSEFWITYNNGVFWSEYSRHRIDAQTNVIEAKKIETLDPDGAMISYENAFINYRKAENLIRSNNCMLLRSLFHKYFNLSKNFSWWFLGTVLLTLISTIIGLFV